MTSPKPNNSELARVAVKPPPFWPKDPELWFVQLESQFAVAGITADETKFYTTVSAIDASILQSARDLILKPPEEKKYDALKDRLISLFADSESARLQQLLQDTQLGDMRPSQLLAKMKDLAGQSFGDPALKSLWLNRLPTQTQAILAVSSEPLEKLAQMADKIHELAPPTPFQIQAMHQDPHSSAHAPWQQQIDMLADKLEKLTASINRTHGRPFRPRSRSRSRSNQRSKNDNNNKNYCFYHNRFGAKAHKCTQPCSYANSGN